MRNETTGEEKIKRSGLSVYFDWAGAITITVIIGFLILMLINFICEKKVAPTILNSHKTSYIIYKKNTKYNKDFPFDSLTFLIQKQNIQLTDSLYNIRQEINSIKLNNEATDSQLKLIGALVAVIFAISGFFGFKSLNEIREYTIKEAKLDAEKTSRLIAEKTAKETSEEKIKEGLGQLNSRFYALEEVVSGKVSNNKFDELEQNFNELNDFVEVCCESMEKEKIGTPEKPYTKQAEDIVGEQKNEVENLKTDESKEVVAEKNEQDDEEKPLIY